MTEQAWKWARLDSQRIALLREAEETLGADIVMAYAPGEPEFDPRTTATLAPAELDESQLECLQGLEAKLGAVAVAYRLTA